MPPKETPPAGVRALAINNKQMESYGLKTGPGRKDTLLTKLFNKEEMLAEVAKLGFYSAWNDIKADVAAYDGVELLVVADHEEKYGENWSICLTEAAKEAFYWVRSRQQTADSSSSSNVAEG
jgi:hypothetical protein